MKELLTASRMGTLLGCPRRHFWRYEIGLKAETEAHALRFGSAWHAAMEARWRGEALEKVIEAAVGMREPVTECVSAGVSGSGNDEQKNAKGREGSEVGRPVGGGGAVRFEEIDLAILTGLLTGYWARYSEEIVKELQPEVEFRHAIEGSRTFDSAGKIDGLGVLHDGRLALVEHKTTSESLDSGSDYWLRLRLNQQVMQYVVAARALGWDVGIVLYDVTKKPAIRQRQGETVAEFAERLAADTQARPEFYFARREVPILDQDLDEFRVQRYELSKLILALRQAERRTQLREQAWPRNVNGMTCQMCEFAGFCLQGVHADAEHLPAGFRVGAVHGELGTVGQ